MRLPLLIWLSISLFISLFIVSTFANAAAWQILVPGRYQDGEAPLLAGEGWLGLAVINGKWHLVPTTVQVKRVTNPLLIKEDPPTGIEIASKQADTLVLLRAPGLKVGKIATPNVKFKNHPHQLSSQAKPLVLRFEYEDYSLGVTQDGVLLHKADQKTRLLDVARDSAALLWAGDIDGDRKLDFLFASGKNGSGVCLYLSGIADKGELVKKLACHANAAPN